MAEKFTEFLIPASADIKQALKQLDVSARKILFVVDEENKLIGSLTDGDIRRWILKDGNLSDCIERVCNKKPVVAKEDCREEQIKQEMLARRIECIPVLNQDNIIIDLYFWDEIFEHKIERKVKKQLDLPVVVMAGGEGTRLDPFTRILPKPLIPIEGRTILELIIDKFLEYKIQQFYISINRKSRIIKSYFEELEPPYAISFLYEDKPLGTAGSLKLLEGQLHGSFFVTNCDILIDADYSDLADFHHRNDHDMTLVASVKHFNIPYGICEIENGGFLKKLREKPEYSFLTITGLYIIKAETLKFIPTNEYFHMTHLIEKIKESGGKVAVYPISEKSWIDIGEWSEYKKALGNLQK